jgi:carbon storage regulator
MLVLARKIGQQIVIADNIHVTVLAVMGSKVRLGITAPPEIGVVRQELLKGYCNGAAPQTVGENTENHPAGGARS